jgi:hypothetical protein
VRLLGVGDHAGGRKLSHDGAMLKHETAGNEFFEVADALAHKRRFSFMPTPRKIQYFTP